MAGEIERVILELAATHHGVVEVSRLEAAGVDRRRLAARVRSGLLRPVRRGLYLVEPLSTRWTDISMAILSVSDGVASHRSAARLHGLRLPGTEVDISVGSGATHRIGGAIVHETSALAAADRTIIEGLAVTAIERTLCDLATVLRPAHHRHVVQSQLLTGSPTPEALVACHRALARSGRNGTVAMRRLLGDLIDDEPYPQSDLELRVLTELVHRGAPPMHRQFRPNWYDGRRGVVDFAEPIGRTILEADGRRWHSTDQDRRRDADRDRTAAINGWLVLRVGWHEVVHRPEATMSEVVAVIEARLAAASSVGSSSPSNRFAGPLS